MRIAQFAIFASLAVAASTLPACTSSDTILALNVTASDNVGSVSALNVTVTQEGHAPFSNQFMPPTVPVDGGTVISPSFFQRIKLPDGFANAEATVAVDALDEGGKVFLSASTTTPIEPNGATTAFVMLAREMPDAGVPDAGMEDAGMEDAGMSDAGMPDAGTDGGT